MKKILVLLLLVVLCCSFFASCDKLPPEIMDKVSPVLEKVGLSKHEHEFVKTGGTATCTESGVLYYECLCGETKEEASEALGHSYEVTFSREASCCADGATTYKCTVCGTSKTETVTSTVEHSYDESVGASRILKCSNPSCTSIKIREFEGKYKDEIVYKFSEEDLNKFYEIYDKVEVAITAAEEYNPELHKYVKGSELEAQYIEFEKLYEELYDVLEYVVSQYQIAEIEYHVDMKSKTAKSNFDYMSELRTELVAEFYSFSEPIYKSKYRDYYYEGMTDAEIQAFIFESNSVASEEYKGWVESNNDIELEYNDLTDDEIAKSESVPELYATFVANNSAIANKMGYSNYVEYAYESIYSRDYTYQDVQIISDYVKEYLAPVYKALANKWASIYTSSTPKNAVNQLYNQYVNSFFETYDSNRILNDYIDLLEFNAEQNISFSDEFDKLFENGNIFLGEYEGAYVTYLYGLEIPVAYFGPGYDNPFTVVHEFGHYMNDIYSDEKYTQSYDLLEMHSQGNEMLYLAYLNGVMSSKTAYELVKTYNTYNMLNTIIIALAVDTFEQAVYTNSYDGTYSSKIMADGTISSDEYDLLFESVIADFGVSGYLDSTYWRYVVIHAPCYYVSYSISAISVLQIYPMACEDFDTAKDAYLKLFTYVDNYESEENYEYMSTEEVLLNAGLYSFTDERLYTLIYESMYEE